MQKIRCRADLGIFLKEKKINGNGIEIGVDNGLFSEVIIRDFGLSKIYLLDAWKKFDDTEYMGIMNSSQEKQDEKYQKVLEKFSCYGEKVKVIRKDSREGFKDFNDGFFDFIYIDANHEYSHVKTDIENWYSKLSVNGVFSGHDYINTTNKNGEYGVKKAVDEFCDKLGIKPFITYEKRYYKSWYFVKPS
jgi:hypothetical protein